MASDRDVNAEVTLLVPVGTHVVTRVSLPARGGSSAMPAGAVGEILEAPLDGTHAYRVRLVNGVEVSLRRRDFAIRKHAQREGLEPDGPLHEYSLWDHVIYRCVVGSRAYGLDTEDSDTDRRGVYLPPADLQWSLYGVPEQLENDETQECYWELRKFLLLALKANPNVLECLYTPLVETKTALAEELLAMRTAFLSKLIYQTYSGYVMSQFKKLEQDLRVKGEIRWKHAMHLVRLLLSGIATLREGAVPVCVEAHRERLLEVREGGVPWDALNAWRLELHRDFDEAYGSTGLPERPDYEKANRFLIRARRSVLEP